MTYHVGQKLWCVMDRNRRHEFEVEVTKVARKWVSIGKRYGDGPPRDCGRFQIDGSHLDGGQWSSPGRVWPSKEAWETYRDLEKAWSDFRMNISRTYHMPEHLTGDDIKRMTDAIYHGGLIE